MIVRTDASYVLYTSVITEIIQRIQAIGIYSILSNNSHKIG
jgi:hypothetical protein